MIPRRRPAWMGPAVVCVLLAIMGCRWRFSQWIASSRRGIYELRSDDEINAAFPLMRTLRDRIEAGTFLHEVRRQQAQGYEFIGAFADGRLVALAGVRRTHTLSRGEHVFVDDLVTDVAVYGRGYSSALVRWLAIRAAAEGIPRIYLDSRNTARGFYEKLGSTFHTSIPCWLDIPNYLAEGLTTL